MTITARTQRRIWSQVNHFLDWVVYEGHLEQNPFRTVLFDRKVRPAPYAVPTDDEVVRLLQAKDRELHPVLLTCLLSGMRAGEAVGLLREDLVTKGNLGCFVHVQPNELRLLKTDAAERLVPVHPVLDDTFRQLPSSGPLFPDLTVAHVTKGFARLRRRLGLERPGLVFHSTRKWFVTQCERTGVYRWKCDWPRRGYGADARSKRIGSCIWPNQFASLNATSCCMAAVCSWFPSK